MEPRNIHCCTVRRALALFATVSRAGRHGLAEPTVARTFPRARRIRSKISTVQSASVIAYVVGHDEHTWRD